MCHEQFSSQAAATENGGGESLLSKRTIGYMHCNMLRPKNSLNDASTLLFSIRDPMDRIVSWFQYMHPQNCLPSRPSAACNLKKQATAKDKESYNWGLTMFEKCFHDVNDMIKSIQNDLSTTKRVAMKGDVNCTKLAIDTITGNGPPGPSNHLYFNYHYYLNKTSTIIKQQLLEQQGAEAATKQKHIVVVRQDALWDDLRSIEYMLGGSFQRKFENEGPVVTHNSELYPYKAKLDPELMPTLCCAIPNEITIYVNLISNAINIDPIDRISTIREFYTKCDIPTVDQHVEQVPNDAALLFLSQISAKCRWNQQVNVGVTSMSAMMSSTFVI